jgi:hypothetical protein
MARRTYVETFDDGPGGWVGWSAGVTPLETTKGAVVSRSPWWIDANHAPPGGGYLHLLFVLYTKAQRTAKEIGGANRFVEGGYQTDFTNAKMTLRLRGDLDAKGTSLVLLAQARVGDRSINHVLNAQPFDVTREWSEQAISLAPDPEQWLCLGSRHDRTGSYGWGDVADVLRDLNLDIILVLHPVDVAPAAPIEHDPHFLYAGRDYYADQSRLPSGHVELDEVRIEFAE